LTFRLRPVRLLFAILLAALLLSPGRAAGQDSGRVSSGDRSLGAWFGVSPDSPVGTQLGQIPDRELFLLGLRAEWVLEDRGPFWLSSTADLLPLAIVTNNPLYHWRTYTTEDGIELPYREETGRAPVFGAGFSPLGWKLGVTPSPALHLFAAGAVGILWFTRNTPVPDARRMNFTFEYGGGIELPRTPLGVLVLGYKFHHLSNAYTADSNPGLDGNVVYLGVLRRRR
jgi:hypothetical protein